MTNATKILIEEHKIILSFIDTLVEKADELEKGKLDKEFFINAVDFIRSYADKFHHAKEENILFKELNKSEGMHCNPVQQMLYEHDSGRKFVKGMEEALKENDKAKLIENVKNYIGLLREHITKEDNILYPMAEEGLDENTKKEMLRKFEKADEKKKKDREKALSFVKNLK